MRTSFHFLVTGACFWVTFPVFCDVTFKTEQASGRKTLKSVLTRHIKESRPTALFVADKNGEHQIEKHQNISSI